MTPQQRLVDLCAAQLARRPLKIMPFWGHKPTPSGAIGAGCLSQWWPAAFTVDGLAYPTAEHWMMAGKARLFADDDGVAAVLAAKSPGAAKAAGRKVRGFDEQRWTDARYDLVVAGNLAKFGQHPNLREFLVATGDRVLVEASPYDRIWGIGMAPTHPDVQRPSAWRGLNLLGFALMDVRERL
ncbi:NADAR family protein [Micromonospora sp. CPCC 206061]|uniref:NADAR family protein n=1 Tax=Micromonospora sp. CPCC 206061 TaxID=3122410 RepID=UPI002FF2C603